MRHNIYSLMHCVIITISLIFISASCTKKNTNKNIVAPWGVINDTLQNFDGFDLDNIVSNGELIMATLNGPESYYDYRGGHLGTQFLLCQKFANKLGVSLRVEVCRDTMDMVEKLIDGDVDVIAYWLTKSDINNAEGDTSNISLCGPTKTGTNAKWVVVSKNDDLVAALNEWYAPSLLSQAQKEEAYMRSSRSVRHRMFAPMLDSSKGIISQYDWLFVKYGKKIRWDWRLLAAQCYQESTFDPNAKSWAGACGLMQIMPETSAHLNLPLSKVFLPEPNIDAATRYIAELENKFTDIDSRYERINFILASYNGGYHHIRDAMRLTEKNGKNPKSWHEVSKYVLLLSNSRYYNDPVVKYGFMYGSETVDYVDKIRQRWRQYSGISVTRSENGILTPQRAKRHKKKYRLVNDID